MAAAPDSRAHADAPWRRVLRHLRRARHGLAQLALLPRYLYYHKLLFRITNTKFDISFCVFRESFVADQYGIRRFLRALRASEDIFFLDLGRNHGFVFYYAMYEIMKSGFDVSTVRYFGIDPSPLKFVYFNFHDALAKRGIDVRYHLINRAVVFNDERIVRLKYGEDNFGNFHVSGSNYDKWARRRPQRFEFVELAVETLPFAAVKTLVRENAGSGALIVKIDCKNRTEVMFAEILDILRDRAAPWLLSAERDGSAAGAGHDVAAYARPGAKVLTASNVAGPGPAG